MGVAEFPGDGLIIEELVKSAEAESAGLQLAALHCIGTGVRDSSEGYALAELSSGGEQYVLRATRCIKQYDAIVVHADRPNRWEVL